jgi:hypothetical protein
VVDCTKYPTFVNFAQDYLVGAINKDNSIDGFMAMTLYNFQIGTSATTLYGNYPDTSQLGQGTILADTSGKGNNGTLIKGAGAYPTWVNGYTANNFAIF